MTTRVAFYLRVSKADDQTPENQLRQLNEAAQRLGWDIVEVFTDHGISGSKGRDRRPAFDRLIKGVTQGRFDLVAAWSVDRLGRSLSDLIAFLSELQARKVDLFLHQQALRNLSPGTIRKRRQRGWTDDEIIEGKRGFGSAYASQPAPILLAPRVKRCAPDSRLESHKPQSCREILFERMAEEVRHHRERYGEEYCLCDLDTLNEGLPPGVSPVTPERYRRKFGTWWEQWKSHLVRSNLPVWAQSLIAEIERDTPTPRVGINEKLARNAPACEPEESGGSDKQIASGAGSWTLQLALSSKGPPRPQAPSSKYHQARVIARPTQMWDQAPPFDETWQEREFKAMAKEYREARGNGQEEPLPASLELLNEAVLGMEIPCPSVTMEGYERHFRRLWPRHKPHVRFDLVAPFYKALIQKIDPDYVRQQVAKQERSAIMLAFL